MIKFRVCHVVGLGLLVLTGLILLPGQVNLPVTDRDEALYVQSSKQMVESGNYGDIRFQDTPRYKKPIGIYWFQALSVHAVEFLGLGDRNDVWVYRLPSSLGGIACVGVLYWGLINIFPWSSVACALLLFLSTGAFVIQGHLARADMMLLLSIVSALVALANLALRACKRLERRGLQLLLWLAIALGILIKGPLVLWFVASTGLFYRLLKGKFFNSVGWGIGVALVVLLVSPWLVYIGISSGGAFYQESLVKDLFHKVGNAAESHGAFPGFFFLSYWLQAWPGSLLLYFSLPFFFLKRTWALPQNRFLIAWMLPSYILFELISTKLSHYLLPILPAAFLLGIEVLRGYEVPTKASWRIFESVYRHVVAIIWGVVTLLMALLVGLMTSWVALALGGIALGVLYLYLSANHKVIPLVALLGLMGGISFMSISPSLRVELPWMWNSVRVHEQLAGAYTGEQIAAWGYTEPSLVFYLGKDIKRCQSLEEVQEAVNDYERKCMLIERRRDKAFREMLEAKGLTPYFERTLLTQGINYARGQPIKLFLYERKDV